MSYLSPEGDNIMNFLKMWEISQKSMKEGDDKFVRAKMLVDGNDYIFFFVCKGSIYGANENARAVFSVMKNPMGEVGYEEMNFQATNLSQAMIGDPKEEIFVYKDIENIKVIRKDEAYDKLMEKKHKGKHAEVSEKMKNIQTHRSERDRINKGGKIHLDKDVE